MHCIRGFTEFEGFCTGRFRPGTQLFKSAMSTNFITPARADGILPLVTPALATDFTVTGNGQRNALFIRGRHDGRLPARPAVLSGLPGGHAGTRHALSRRIEQKRQPDAAKNRDEIGKRR